MELNKKPWPLATVCGVKERIDARPDFQRPPVWKRGQKQFLIDTVLQNLDIPKLYWRKTGKNPDQYEVVDGQQRLRAIWEFHDGQFRLSSEMDAIDGHTIAGLTYSELPDELRIRFDTYPLDVVIVSDADEDDVRDMFLRLQNGTPLKAQEKRNAMGGKMRDFVKDLATDQFFTSVPFKDSRYTFDLVCAQMTLLELSGKPCDVRNSDLNEMYASNTSFEVNGPTAKKVRRVLSFLKTAFPEKTPELERYNVVSLYVLVSNLFEKFVMTDREQDLKKWFLDFETKRSQDEALPDANRDAELLAYHDVISHSTDNGWSIAKRYDVLSRSFLIAYPGIKQKDNQREFTHEQRMAIFRRDGGRCQVRLKCDGAECSWDNWHADHKIPWSQGGFTVVENGQVACVACNTTKSDS
jgi:hypothetical protein